jgi:hypothetical protein
MEAHKTVRLIRRNDKENDGRDESKVGECPRDGFGENANLALRTLFGLHREAATGTESRGLGHLSSAVRARRQADTGGIHCPDHIKTEDGQQMGRITLAN